MDKQWIFKMSFASEYPLYVQKAVEKGRKKKEVDEVICWLTGYRRARQRAARSSRRRSTCSTE